MGTKRRQRGEPQHPGPYLRIGGRSGRCFVRFSLLPIPQIRVPFCLTVRNIGFFRPADRGARLYAHFFGLAANSVAPFRLYCFHGFLVLIIARAILFLCQN